MINILSIYACTKVASNQMSGGPYRYKNIGLPRDCAFVENVVLFLIPKIEGGGICASPSFASVIMGSSRVHYLCGLSLIVPFYCFLTTNIP